MSEKGNDSEVPATTSSASTTPPIREEQGNNKLRKNVIKRRNSDAIKPESGDLLTLEYSTPDAVATHVQELFEIYKEKMLSSAELLWLLIYVMALECGYAEENVYLDKRHKLGELTPFSSFHAANVRKLSVSQPTYTKEFNDSTFSMKLRTLVKTSNEVKIIDILQSRLMGIVVGDLLMVTLSPLPQLEERGYSVCLSIGRFVLNIQARNKPQYNRFRQLRELSFQLRDQLFHPMRMQQLMCLEEQHQYPSLLGLPDELYDRIFEHLSKNQLGAMANVNHQLNNCSKRFAERYRKKKKK